MRSAQATDRGSAYHALAVKGAKTAETERGGILQLRIFFGVNRRAMTMQAAKWKKLIARFDPRYPRCGRLSFAAIRDAQVSAGRLAI